MTNGSATTNKKASDKPAITRSEIEESLSKVLASKGFANSERIRSFLSYVVNETTAGRSDEIKGKTIALDVYRRDPTVDGDPENVVRVDARRLRRSLATYYDQDGAEDAIRIHIDSGGYVPRFESVQHSGPATENQVPADRAGSKKGIAFAVGAAIILAGLFFWTVSEKPAQIASGDQRILERQALLEKSVTALQAVNMAEQAKGIIFPIFDFERQKLALGIFDQVIHLDPDFFGGYAGAAFSLATLALLSPDPAHTETYLDQAKEKIEKSIELNPTAAWTQASSAWVAFANGEFEQAQELSARAYGLDQEDWYVSDIHGIVSLFTGDFIEAKNVSAPKAADAGSNRRSGNRNIYAAANFHLGEYRATLTTFKEIGELGGPVSAPRLAYQSAAKHAIGDLNGARVSASELMATWPDAQVDIVLFSFFQDPVHAEDVVKRLQESGWTAQR